MAIYYLKSVNLLKKNINLNIVNNYFSKMLILFFLIISLKTFYLIYFFILIIWIFEMRQSIFDYNFFKLIYQVLLGQEQGPRLGSFIKLYGINKTVHLIDNILNQH